MTCEHMKITIVNRAGKRHEYGGREVDFIIRCNDCDRELFKISEYRRTFINLSKH